MLIIPTSPAFSCLRFLFVLLTRPSASALVFKIYWGNHDLRVVWTVEQVNHVWTVEQVNHVWTQNPGIVSGHKTRESSLDTKHVNRVWKLEELNPSYLFLFVLLTRPSASALVFKTYWGNRDQRLVWTVEQVSRGWTQNT